MNNINFTRDNCKEESTSIWLAAVMQFGLKMSFFKPFEDFNLKMKKVKYSVYQKLVTTMMSIVIGCRSTKDINERLSVEKLSANMFGMDTIPDQSQINLLLTRFDSSSILQLQHIHHKIFMDNSNSISNYNNVVVDCDQTGLIANGKTFELAQKGYFSKRKNQSGYQLAAHLLVNTLKQ
jgi:hypothetical protein